MPGRASNGEIMSEQDYERYSSLTEDEIETCYKVLDIVRERYGEEDEFWDEQDMRRAKYLIGEFEEEMELDNE